MPVATWAGSSEVCQKTSYVEYILNMPIAMMAETSRIQLRFLNFVTRCLVFRLAVEIRLDNRYLLY